jgi:hypothetical protein
MKETARCWLRDDGQVERRAQELAGAGVRQREQESRLSWTVQGALFLYSVRSPRKVLSPPLMLRDTVKRMGPTTITCWHEHCLCVWGVFPG